VSDRLARKLETIGDALRAQTKIAPLGRDPPTDDTTDFSSVTSSPPFILVDGLLIDGIVVEIRRYARHQLLRTAPTCYSP